GYFMVRVCGKGAPTKSHLTLETAKAEAQRLAQKEGKVTWVLQAVGCFRPQGPPVEWLDCAYPPTEPYPEAEAQ
ncbi:MAG: hypothetical protein ACREUG_17000, partial [Steroidobacteraceae bacterium]